MNIYKLLLGIVCTGALICTAPFLFEHFGWIGALTDKTWLILLLTGGGLIAKTLIGDVASGEFLFHKYGYDNCIMTFGASLTAVVLQLTSKVDLFPGLSSAGPLTFVSSIVTDPLSGRNIQLFIFFFVTLLATLLTAKISGAIENDKVPARGILALINSIVGLFVLGLYVLILITKG